jgi:hypothetical protein
VNKAVECSICYGLGFSDFEILNDRDFVAWVHKRYGECYTMDYDDLYEAYFDSLEDDEEALNFAEFKDVLQ